MNTFEQLEEQACKDGIDIIERKFNSERIKDCIAVATLLYLIN